MNAVLTVHGRQNLINKHDWLHSPLSTLHSVLNSYTRFAVGYSTVSGAL